jgi:glyoxylase-like metal-dependent hydrolase (beta-lactamase superfamily II)
MQIKALALLVLLAACGSAAAASDSYFTLHDLGHNVWAAVAVPKSGAGSNAGFVIGSDSVAVIDTFEEPAAAKALLAAIRSKTQLPVRYVVNTHYHLDHVAGNNVFARAGAVILAQRNVREWERTENLKFFGDKITPQQRQMVASLGLPTITYRRGIELWLGNRKLEVRVLPGHTGSDSIVVVPDANVVFTGDLFWNHSLPNLIDADTRAQINSNDVLLSNYSQATFVPGHGNTGHAADVRAFRDYLLTLRLMVARGQSEHKSGAALVAAVLPKLELKYRHWMWFRYFIRDNIEQTAAELDGTKKVPIPGKP